MRAEHTPGPWTVGQYTPSPHFLAIKNHSCVCDPKTQELIATCGRADDRQSQIDADLIAAAPDLLAACERIVARYRQLEDSEPVMGLGLSIQEMDAVIGDAIDAIRKARGQLSPAPR